MLRSTNPSTLGQEEAFRKEARLQALQDAMDQMHYAMDKSQVGAILKGGCAVLEVEHAILEGGNAVFVVEYAIPD